MKKIIFAFFAITLLSLSSCSNDDSAESFGETTGDYFPLAINNSWKYLDVDQSLLNEIKIIGTAQFNGTTYYEFTDDSETDIVIKHWFAKKGATYFLKTDDTTVNESGINITVGGYELPILKDDYPVNKSWTGTVSPKLTFSGNGQSGTLPFKVNYTGVNLYKGEVVLNSITYPSVIKTRISVVVNANGQITNASEEYWYAENVGLIKTINQSENDLIEERDIYSYILN